jgi:N-acetylneuraminate synthase/N,N'-diacetyllegionaminate synthase
LIKKIKIGNCLIGNDEPVYIIAEIGINHNGDVQLAKHMIDVAIECGVNALKFQIFKAEEFVSDSKITYTYFYQGEKITESMLRMFKRYEFDKNEWTEIFNYCSDKKIDYFATPQNLSDLDFLLSIVDVPAIKVGSDDLTNLDLLEGYARKGKPLIISAGMAFLSEIEDAVNIVRGTGNHDLAILHCISTYPTDAEDVHLRKMLTIRQAFNVITGFSDHTQGSTASLGAVALGASIIEKHFTLDKNLPGPDQWFSANPEELKDLVECIRFLEKAMGDRSIQPTLKECEMRKLTRRSIIASKNIAQGEVISREAIGFKRPGTGLPPKFLLYVLGKKSTKDIKENEQITFEKLCGETHGNPRNFE